MYFVILNSINFIHSYNIHMANLPTDGQSFKHNSKLKTMRGKIVAKAQQDRGQNYLPSTVSFHSL